jgi:geranylgeranyl diphosphate synthase, type II
MFTGVAFDFQRYLDLKKAQLENELADVLSSNDPEILWESMRYSVLSAGKRVRGVLCLAAAEAAATVVDPQLKPALANAIALPCACAIEMIHAMSLIHDDLPCMDNDDLRRGRPTNHKVFGEAMALLAGDALLVLASETLLARCHPAVELARLMEVSLEMVRTAGARGLVGGQVADMATTGCSDLAPAVASEKLRIIHERKTGALLRFSVWSGGCLVGADEGLLKALGRFGEVLGLSFQIADDLLDVTGSAESLGKTPGKDQIAGKLTWVSVYGIDGARGKLRELEEEGKRVLAEAGLGEEASAPLIALLEYSINRRN